MWKCLLECGVSREQDSTKTGVRERKNSAAGEIEAKVGLGGGGGTREEKRGTGKKGVRGGLKNADGEGGVGLKTTTGGPGSRIKGQTLASPRGKTGKGGAGQMQGGSVHRKK